MRVSANVGIVERRRGELHRRVRVGRVVDVVGDRRPRRAERRRRQHVGVRRRSGAPRRLGGQVTRDRRLVVGRSSASDGGGGGGDERHGRRASTAALACRASTAERRVRAQRHRRRRTEQRAVAGVVGLGAAVLSSAAPRPASASRAVSGSCEPRDRALIEAGAFRRLALRRRARRRRRCGSDRAAPSPRRSPTLVPYFSRFASDSGGTVAGR